MARSKSPAGSRRPRRSKVEALEPPAASRTRVANDGDGRCRSRVTTSSAVSILRASALPDGALGCAAALLALVCYANALQGDYVFDDTYAVTGNADVTGADGVAWWAALPRIFLAHDFWGQRIDKPDSHKSWRPVTTLTLRLSHALGGARPEAHHILNVVLHAAASFLVAMLSRDSGADAASALVAV